MSVKKNFIYNIAYQILHMILPLITAPYIARVLGAELIGIYSYTYSIAYYFVLFAQLGLSVYGNRSIAQVRDDKALTSKTFNSIFALQSEIAGIAVAAYCIYVAVFGGQYRLYFIIQGLYVLSGFFDISWFYFGIEKFKLTVTRNTIVKVSSAVLILLFVKDQDDLIKYVLIMAGSVLLGQISLWFQLFKYVEFRPFQFTGCLEHLKPVLILFLPTVATSLYRVMDKIMLGNMQDITQLGYYENSEKFISICMAVVNALGTVMIPRMSNLLIHGKKQEADRYISRSMEGMYIIAAALSFGLFSVSDILSVVFYGNEFSACADIIKVLSLSLIFSTWANIIRTQFLVPIGKDREYIISMFSGAAVNIAINLALIPRIGAVGAAVGTVFAEFAVAFAHSWYTRKDLPLKKFFKMAVPYVSIGAGMSCFVIFVKSFVTFSIFGLMRCIVAGAVFYIAGVGIYLCIVKDDIYHMAVGMLKSIVRKYCKRAAN